MKPSLTIIYCSARKEPHFEWFVDSLRHECAGKDSPDIIFVDFEFGRRGYPACVLPVNARHVPCKPTIWQGEHKITKDDWWAKSAYLNTGACIAKTDWIAFLDDRCVLVPGWLKCVREAMAGNYAVAGSYQKRINMKVEDGYIVENGEVTGHDTRNPKGQLGGVIQTFGDHWFGCNNALPLEWFLEMNGAPEDVCDSLGYEDTIMGNMLIRNGFVTKYDPRMKVIQDRTLPESDSLVKRTDWGSSPNDKSHAIERKISGSKTSLNSFSIRAVRDAVQKGEPFPPPSASHVDWYDNADIPTKFNAA